MKPIRNKVVIIGAGMVGAAVLNSILTLNLLAEVVIIDKNSGKAKGEALDASHTTSFAYSPNVSVKSGDYEDCRDAQIIIMTAGPSMKPGEKLDRMILADINVKVMKEVMDSITQYTKEAIIIIVTNPVDVVTYFAQTNFDYPKEKIIGTGTLLDTARLRRILALKYLVDTKNVHGYILGEHGLSAFVAWSLVNIAGIPANKLNEHFNDTDALDYDAILQETKSVGTDILQLKGYTSSGIAMSVSRLVKAILLNELSILPVSTTLEGEYGITDTALSIPCVISNEGISRRLEVPLSEVELQQLKNSADSINQVIDNLGIRK
jgi:L-lactate dehydrogenase